MSETAQCETGAITRILLKHPRDAFRDAANVAVQWRELNFTAPPEISAAIAEYDRFISCLSDGGLKIHFLPESPGTTLDSIYVRDASVVTDRGAILCRMGKPARAGEPAAQQAAFQTIGYPIAGAISAPGQLEGGDVLWLDRRTIVVGRGYRTNDAGIAQLRGLLDDDIDQLIVVPLPHWRGSRDVFHLMSIVSPVDHDLAVVYSPLMPIPFRELLRERGMSFVEVPDEEFATMGANVLALGRRRALVLSGNPVTRRRLEAAGVEVMAYGGDNISVKGGGGPTCLTRPLLRAANLRQ
ncbi:MAG: dimethylarginine dimethylaminohydrolase family protein [Vicinamibacterales bacterium]